MKKTGLAYILLMLSILVANRCLSQEDLYGPYGNVMPCQKEYRFAPNSALFRRFVYSIGYVWDKNECAFFPGFPNCQYDNELDSIYMQFADIIPGFKVYPEFVVDCGQGYIIGLNYYYGNFKTVIINLELRSFDYRGNLLQKTTFPVLHHGYFYTRDTCPCAFLDCGGEVKVIDGHVIFDYSSLRICTPEIGVVKEDWGNGNSERKKKYVYIIKNDARLVLVSETEE